MELHNKPYLFIMIKQTSTNLMGGSGKYTSPKCEVIDLAMDTAVCQASGVDTASFGYDELFDLGEI